MDFSHILHEEYILKQEVMVVEISEWKLKAKIARNNKIRTRFLHILGRR